jgi:hypothetical protein
MHDWFLHLVSRSKLQKANTHTCGNEICQSHIEAPCHCRKFYCVQITTLIIFATGWLRILCWWTWIVVWEIYVFSQYISKQINEACCSDHFVYIPVWWTNSQSTTVCLHGMTVYWKIIIKLQITAWNSNTDYLWMSHGLAYSTVIDPVTG